MRLACFVFRRTRLASAVAGFIAAFLCAVPIAFAIDGTPQSCAALSSLAVPNTTITTAAVVTGGSFTPPGATSAITGLPDFCRVAFSVAPTPDSDIRVELWMPMTGWNGRFEGTGNGGLAGAIAYSALAPGLQLGFATANTDTGHTNAGGAGSFALGHPEKIIDYGWRGIHEMTEKSKIILSAFYGNVPQRSYFSGCSQGGQEAFMEVQRFPYDYDGILAGDPDNFQTRHEVGAHLWVTWNEFGPDPNGVLPASKLTLLGNAVNAACDKLDGVADGIIADPLACHFDPGVLQCTGADAPNCLTAAQVQVVRNIYAGPNAALGIPGYYPGFEPGGEALTWQSFITPIAPNTDFHAALGLPFFKFFVFDNPNWDFHTFNWKTDAALVDNKQVDGETLAQAVDAVNPNLRPFRLNGGKMIHYHGFSDPDVPPLNSINYYDMVVATNAKNNPDLDNETPLADTQEFYRLFMVPGMGHCGGGPGANVFGGGGSQVPGTQTPQNNMLLALVQWVEQGVAPDRIIATKFVNNDMTMGVQMTRPLCPFPQLPFYSGTGSTNDAASFVCRVPAGLTVP